MFRISLPFTDAGLLLTPRWEDLSALAKISTLFFAVLVPTILVLLYLYEMRLVPRRTARSLLTLRLLVIFFLMFVVFLQPIISRTKTEEIPGRVLVAIDRSDSMKVADPQREAVEKLRLARALKITVEGCSDEQLAKWIRQYEEKNEPVWVEKDEIPDDPKGKDDPKRRREIEEKRRELEEKRRKQHEEICQRVDRMTRLGVVQKVLSEEGVDLLDAISQKGKKHKIEIVGFARDAEGNLACDPEGNLQKEKLAELFAPFAEVPDKNAPRKDDKKDEKDPKALKDKKESDKKEDKKSTDEKDQKQTATDCSDLRKPLEYGLSHSGKAEGKILGVVLLSDGQHNKHDVGGQTPVAKALELKEHNIPIYPVVIGGRKPPPDIALVSVTAPPAVFKDVEAAIEARVKVSGLPKQEIVVELHRPDGKEPLVQRIQHDGSDRFHPLRFQVKLDKVGAQTLTMSVKSVKDEVRTDNNSRPIAVNVADDKAKVLVVDGEARWEFHYLYNALLRDKTMDVQSIVFNQPRLGRVPEEDLEKMKNPRLQWPAGPDALASYDCIVLGDVSPAFLPLEDRVRLEKYVSERGGTLVVVAGKRYMPQEFVKIGGKVIRSTETGEEKVEPDPLLKLLPIQEPRVIRPLSGFPVTLTHQGRLTKFLEMDPSPEKSEKRWAELPRHYWGVIGRAKPAATPLAYVASSEDLLAAAAAADPDSEKDPGRLHGLIVSQNYGFGRVIFIGLDSTWRFRYRVGDTYHHRFWGQLIRWAASDKPLVAGNEYIRFGTREPAYRQGAEIDLIARLSDGVKPLGANAVAGARLIRINPDAKEAKDKEEVKATVEMRRRAAEPRVLEGRAPNSLPAGQYVVELDMQNIPEMMDKMEAPPTSDGKPGKLRAGFTVTPVESEESIEMSANWPLMEELAIKSEGKSFTPENAKELVELLTQKTVTNESRKDNKLWEEWPTLVFFLGLLTVEWVMRKMAGLA